MHLLLLYSVGVAVILGGVWHLFFQWYARKRERESQAFLTSVTVPSI
jgi:hypothetical protein